MALSSLLINLKSWRLGLPVDIKGGISGPAFTINDPANYDDTRYFHRTDDGALQFNAKVDGATTGGSLYARSELREMNGTTPAAWSLAQGGTMTATLKVDQTPKLFDGTPGKIVIGQVHGKDYELVRLYYQNGTVYFANDKTGPLNKPSYGYPVNAEGKVPDISLGEKFSYKIEARGNILSVVVYADGDVYTSTTKINSVWQSDKFYFKAGVYLGVNEKMGTGAGNADFYGLDFSHKPGAGLGGLVLPDLLPQASVDLIGTAGDNVLIGGTGNDSLTGLDGNDRLVGNDGIDTLNGGNGNDILDGGRGADNLRGGDGDDTYIIDNPLDLIVEDRSGLAGGLDTIESYISYLLNQNVENLILAGSSDINATGNDRSNVITGNSGTNVIDGGLGADTMSGGDGNDTYIVNTTTDQVIENVGGGNDTVYASANFRLGDNVETLYLTGSATDGYGNDSDNFLYGNALNNILKGLGGNDYIDGGAGSDTMVGGAGNDTYRVWSKGDIVVENAGEGNDTVISTIDYALGNDVENLILKGSIAVVARGNELDNEITGNIKSNFIYGGLGNDVLTGGGGRDRFVFDTAFVKGDNVDTITDFSASVDKMIFDHKLYTGLHMGNIDKAAFIIGTEALTKSQHFIYDSTTGKVFFDVDGVGGKDQVQVAEVSTDLHLTNENFFIF